MFDFIYDILCIKRKTKKVVWIIGEEDILDTKKSKS